MARFRRSSMALRPVHRIKHVVDFSGAIAAAANTTKSLIESKDAPVLANTQEVETGSKVNGIYLKIEVASDEVATPGLIPNVYLAISKDPGGNLAAVAPNAVGLSDNKRFVIHQEMIMITNLGRGSQPRVLFNGVIAIPRGYRRFGPNDLLNLTLLSPSIDIVMCFQCHYKEFR